MQENTMRASLIMSSIANRDRFAILSKKIQGKEENVTRTAAA
jgi:hypothetical protein